MQSRMFNEEKLFSIYNFVLRMKNYILRRFTKKKEVAISSWIPLSGREHKILESVTMNNEKHRIHKQNSRNKSSQLSKTLKHFYRRRREL